MTTDAPPTTLTAWLLARIAADEENARRYLDLFPDDDMAPLFRRVLAECAAKRAIVELFEWTDGHPCGNGHESLEHCDDFESHNEAMDGWATLRALAAVYADHPEWREEWAL